jgi:hypothetical protein
VKGKGKGKGKAKAKPPQRAPGFGAFSDSDSDDSDASEDGEKKKDRTVLGFDAEDVTPGLEGLGRFKKVVNYSNRIGSSFSGLMDSSSSSDEDSD